MATAAYLHTEGDLYQYGQSRAEKAHRKRSKYIEKNQSPPHYWTVWNLHSFGNLFIFYFNPKRRQISTMFSMRRVDPIVPTYSSIGYSIWPEVSFIFAITRLSIAVSNQTIFSLMINCLSPISAWRKLGRMIQAWQVYPGPNFTRLPSKRWELSGVVRQMSSRWGVSWLIFLRTPTTPSTRNFCHFTPHMALNFAIAADTDVTEII